MAERILSFVELVVDSLVVWDYLVDTADDFVEGHEYVVVDDGNVRIVASLEQAFVPFSCVSTSIRSNPVTLEKTIVPIV